MCAVNMFSDEINRLSAINVCDNCKITKIEHNNDWKNEKESCLQKTTRTKNTLTQFKQRKRKGDIVLNSKSTYIRNPSTSASVYDPYTKWWMTLLPESDVVAFDCECVMIPVTKPYDKRKNRPECAIIGVVDYKEHVVLETRVHHHRGTYKVNSFTKAVNGIQSNDLEIGLPLNVVSKLFEHLCRLPSYRTQRVKHWSRLVVSWGEQETSYLPTPTDLRNIDLQSWFTQCTTCTVEPGKTQPNCGHPRSRLSLAAVYAYYFNEIIQDKIHSPSVDAAATMRIFREIFLPEMVRTNGQFLLKTFIKRKPPYMTSR